jgi:hypothetical protein
MKYKLMTTHFTGETMYYTHLTFHRYGWLLDFSFGATALIQEGNLTSIIAV